MDGINCWFVARGSTFVSVSMDNGDSDILTRNTANHNAGMHPLLTWGAIEVTAFERPLPVGVAPVVRSLEVYFATFVRVFKIVVKDGVGAAMSAAASRVDFLITELQVVADGLREYCQLHYTEFAGRELDVFTRSKQDPNLDWARLCQLGLF